jgi:hypothetical protein
LEFAKKVVEEETEQIKKETRPQADFREIRAQRSEDL